MAAPSAPLLAGLSFPVEAPKVPSQIREEESKQNSEHRKVVGSKGLPYAPHALNLENVTIRNLFKVPPLNQFRENLAQGRVVLLTVTEADCQEIVANRSNAGNKGFLLIEGVVADCSNISIHFAVQKIVFEIMRGRPTKLEGTFDGFPFIMEDRAMHGLDLEQYNWLYANKVRSFCETQLKAQAEFEHVLNTPPPPAQPDQLKAAAFAHNKAVVIAPKVASVVPQVNVAAAKPARPAPSKTPLSEPERKEQHSVSAFINKHSLNLNFNEIMKNYPESVLKVMNKFKPLTNLHQKIIYLITKEYINSKNIIIKRINLNDDTKTSYRVIVINDNFLFDIRLASQVESIDIIPIDIETKFSKKMPFYFFNKEDLMVIEEFMDKFIRELQLHEKPKISRTANTRN